MFNHPHVFTFYTYKGGVGRSLALLNVAYLLAGRGRHVLVVDMDLEAPGISGFLDRQKEIDPPTPGHGLDVLSLLKVAFDQVKGGWDKVNREMKPEWEPGSASRALPPVSTYARAVRGEKLGPMRPAVGDPGRLDVIVADVERTYWKRWDGLGLHGLSRPKLVALSKMLNFYFKAQRFPCRPVGLEPFEAAVETAYDYVLVDSRTGITEIGGLCVGPLADRLVVLTSLNDQNVRGTHAFMKEAGIEPRARVPGDDRWDEADPGGDDDVAKPALGPKPTVLVASPVPTGEIEYKRKRLQELEKLLGLSPSKLSYHPQMALVESVFVRDYPEEYLSLEYKALAEKIMAQVGDHPMQLARQSTDLREERRVDAVKCGLRLASQAPEIGGALLPVLSQGFRPSNDEEFRLKRQLLAFMKQLTPALNYAALNNWGTALSDQAKTKQGETADRLFEAAGQKYAEALRVKPDNHEALYNRACLAALRGNAQEAVEWLTRSVALGGVLDKKKISADEDFDGIRGDAAFREFLESLPDN